MEIMKAIERYTDYAIKLRREIHRSPELSGNEYNTTKLIRRELEQYGIQVRESGLETGVIADIRGKKPGNGRTIAVRADIDALPVQEKTGEEFASSVPGISHACGHDMHTAALLLAARVLKEMEDDFCGTVRLMWRT